MAPHRFDATAWLSIGLAVLFGGCPVKVHAARLSDSPAPTAAEPAALRIGPGQVRLSPPASVAQPTVGPADAQPRDADLDAIAVVRRAASVPGAFADVPVAANLPEMAVRMVRVVHPIADSQTGARPGLRIVEIQLMYLGLPVRGDVLIAYLVDRTLIGLRGHIPPRSRYAAAFRGIKPIRAIGAPRARRVLFGARGAPGVPLAPGTSLELAWDFAARRLVYVGWDEETRTVADALTGAVITRTRFGPVPGWDPYDRAVITGLALAHPQPVELNWPLNTILDALQDFPDSLVDRKITGWLQLTTGWVPKDCSFRLSWAAGEGLESSFPFPSLYPGDTFDTVETRSAPCFAEPFAQRPTATDADPAATRRALGYQNNYLYGMMAARHVAWNDAAGTYLFLEPRQRLALHIKALASVDRWAPGCGTTYACYMSGTHTIRIVDDILFAGMLLHEYGHYVHHTYRPPSFPQNSCLVTATQEGIADAMRSSLLYLVHGETPSDSGFLGSDFPTPTRAAVRSAIRREEECSLNAYGDGSVIGQILQAMLNDRVCTFDESLGPSAPCRIERILGDGRDGEHRVPLWGRQALTHAMMYTGSWSTSEDPPSPYLFVEGMAYWFRVLGEVYGVLQPEEWARLRSLFLMHGLDIGPFQP